MAEASVVDYYATLNLPTHADLMGVENAYARLSSELAELGELDEGATEALRRLNEAYSVLSRPELRREYDRVYLAAERAQEARELEALLRRRSMIQWVIVGALSAVVLSQVGVLLYLARGQF